MAQTALRQSIDSAATAYLHAGAGDSQESIQAEVQKLISLNLPVGWSSLKLQNINWPMKAIGLLVTILAVSAGAPFWHDILRQAVSFRGPNAPPIRPSIR